MDESVSLRLLEILYIKQAERALQVCWVFVRHIAFNYTCDVYEEGVEMLVLSNLSPSDHLQLFRLRFKLIIKQLLAFLGLKKGDFFSAILFKSSPSPSTFKLLKSYSWEYVKLPRNPYV